MEISSIRSWGKIMQFQNNVFECNLVHRLRQIIAKCDYDEV